MGHYKAFILMIMGLFFCVSHIQAQSLQHDKISVFKKEQQDKIKDEILRLKERKKQLLQQEKTINKLLRLKEEQITELEKQLSIKKVA